MWGDDNRVTIGYSKHALERGIRSSIVQSLTAARVNGECKEYISAIIDKAINMSESINVDTHDYDCDDIVAACSPVPGQSYKNISSALGTLINEHNAPRIMQICDMIDRVSPLLKDNSTITLDIFMTAATMLIDGEY
jgi:hypothetical protein